MKNIIKFLSLFTLLLVVTNCDDKEDFEFVPADDNFAIISPSSGSSLIIDNENQNNIALTFVWKDNVTGAENYNVEMSLTEEFTEFTSIGTSNNTTFELTKSELNNILIAYDVPALEENNLYFRVSGNDSTTEFIRLVLTPLPENNPVITSPDSTFEVVLSDLTESETAITVEWEDQDFPEDTTVSIDYYVEVALAGTDFAQVETLGTTQTRILDTTHEDLNDAALNLGLAIETAAQLDLRVRAVIQTANGSLERSSDFITITVTPYEAALAPVLYVVGGGAADAGWAWDNPVVFPLQGTVYSANINLTPENGGNFRFFAQQDWGPTSFNYPYYEDRGYTIDSNLVNAMDGDSNFQFIGTAGEYFLEIDTEAKTITLESPQGSNCEFDQLWLVGAGVPDAGWAWTSPVQLPCTGTGIYSGNVNLQNNGGADNNFRFFTDATLEWASPSFNYPHYVNEGYTIDSDFVDAMDGDNNFAFVGTTGQYFLEIDTINKTITLDAPQTACEYDQLWLVGAGVPDAGWAWTSPVQLPCTGDGVYSGSVTFANDSFRFFTDSSLEWASPSFNFPYFVNEGYTIDANFDNAMDGDSNFSFIGTPGTYTLTVDTGNLTITVE